MRDLRQRFLSGETLRPAFRFALAICLTDAVLLYLFGPGTPASLGSYATIIMLYSLDYAGSTRQRFVGYTLAWLVGLAAVSLGALASQPLALAVAAAVVVSTIFAFSRVLRGYAARAAVVLQGPFFLALIDKETVSELPTLLAAWTTGSVVALVVGMVVFPNNRGGRIRAALAVWLTTATGMIKREAGAADLDRSTEALFADVAHDSMPGAVGRRERALAEMVQSTTWSLPAFRTLTAQQDRERQHATTSNHTEDGLLADAADAFTVAAGVMNRERVTQEVPDLVAVRAEDLEGMQTQDQSDVERHYPARLISIVAMRMLWLAGRATGRQFPEPDIGKWQPTPTQLVRLNLTAKSIWPAYALRAGLCSAACVLLVGLLGIQHGLWIVMAALSITQVSFSATQGGTSAAKVAAGSVAGVLFAGLGPLFGTTHLLFALLLPVMAVLAVVGSKVGPFTAQFLYTPFTLTNLATLEWASERDLEGLRLENIALGVAVAALFTLAVFPYGLGRQLVRQTRQATQSSLTYLQAGVRRARGVADPDVLDLRTDCVAAIVRVESTLDAARSVPVLSHDQLTSATRLEAAARDRLLGGDSCVYMAQRRSSDPRIAPLSEHLAQWWTDHLGVDPSEESAQR